MIDSTRLPCTKISQLSKNVVLKLQNVFFNAKISLFCVRMPLKHIGNQYIFILFLVFFITKL